MPAVPLPPQSNATPPAYQASGEHVNPVDPSLLDLFENDPDEQLICQINKHPIGLVFIWTATLVMFGLIIAASYLVMRFGPEIGIDFANFRTIVRLVFGILAFAVLLGGYVMAWVYKRSSLIVTSEKLVQLIQRNLFDRKISQLSIGDVQDVSVEQRGLAARMFKYGTMTIETAGEHSNYTFDFVPYPYECGKEIVGAHERNLRIYGN
jgi:hypothetical protein